MSSSRSGKDVFLQVCSVIDAVLLLEQFPYGLHLRRSSPISHKSCCCLCFRCWSIRSWNDIGFADESVGIDGGIEEFICEQRSESIGVSILFEYQHDRGQDVGIVEEIRIAAKAGYDGLSRGWGPSTSTLRAAASCQICGNRLRRRIDGGQRDWVLLSGCGRS